MTHSKILKLLGLGVSIVFLSFLISLNIPTAHADDSPLSTSYYTTGDVNVLVLVFQSPEIPQRGTVGQLYHKLFDETNEFSTASYYKASSGGHLRLHGQIVGPITYTSTTYNTDGCPTFPPNYLSLVPTYVDLTQFRQIIVLPPCGVLNEGGGVAAVDLGDGNTHYARLTRVSVVIDPDLTIPGDPDRLTNPTLMITHELGHSFFFGHEHSTSCGPNDYARMNECTYNEYYSPMSIMGFGAGNGSIINIAAAANAGWVPASQQINNPAPGTYNLYSRNVSSGLKHILFNSEAAAPPFHFSIVPYSRPSYISAEFRPATTPSVGTLAAVQGLDSTSPGVIFFSHINSGINVSFPGIEGVPLRRDLTTDRYQKNWNTDWDYERRSEDYVYGAGTGYYDFYTKKGTNVQQVFSDHASVKVVQDPQSCLRDTPGYTYVSSSPVTTSNGHDNLTVTYKVTNRDSSGCGATDFKLETYQAFPYPLNTSGSSQPPLNGYRTVDDWAAPNGVIVSALQPGESRSVTINLSATTGQWRYGAAQFRLKNTKVYGLARTWEDSIIQTVAGCIQERPSVSFTQPTYTQTAVGPLTTQIQVQNMDSAGCPSSIFEPRFYAVGGDSTPLFNSGQAADPPVPLTLSLAPGQTGTITQTYQPDLGFIDINNVHGFTTGLYTRIIKQAHGAIVDPSYFPYVSVASASYTLTRPFVPAVINITSPVGGVVLPAGGLVSVSVDASSPRYVQRVEIYINGIMRSFLSFEPVFSHSNTWSFPASMSFLAAVFVPGANTITAVLHEYYQLGGNSTATSVTVFGSAVSAIPLSAPEPIYPSPEAQFTITPPFSWSEVASTHLPVKYRLQIDDNYEFTSPIIDVSNITTTSYTPLLTSGGTYYWHVSASDNSNPVRTSSYGPRRIFTHTVFNVDCPADFSQDGQTTVEDVFDFINAWFLGHPSSDFNHDNQLTPQDIFDFLNSWFTGCSSSTTDTTPPPVPTITYPPNGIPLTNTPTFNWSAVTDPSGVKYALQVSTNPNFSPASSIVINQSNITSNFYTSNFSLPSGTYSVRVRAFDGAASPNTSAYSSTVTFSLSSDTTAPLPPTIISPANGSHPTANPTFNWTAVNDPSGVRYALQVSTDPTFTSSAAIVISQSNLLGTSYVSSVPLAAGTYNVRARASDNASPSNVGNWSSTTSFIVDANTASISIPSAGAIISGSSVTIAAQVTSNTGQPINLIGLSMQYNNSVASGVCYLTPNALTGSCQKTLNISSLPAGPYVISVNGYDANNSEVGSALINVTRVIP